MPVSVGNKTDYQQSALPVGNLLSAADVNAIIAFINALETTTAGLAAFRAAVDPDSNNTINEAEAIAGVNAAANAALYGKDAAGTVGFHPVVALINAALGGTDWQSGGGGAVSSVQGYTGAVVLDPDDLDDTSTTHKFASAAELAEIAANTAARHTHANQAQLDLIDQDLSNGAAPILDASNMTNIPSPAPVNASLPITLSFQGMQRYNTPASPLTSSLTWSLGSAVDGGLGQVWHQGSANPLDPLPVIAGIEFHLLGGGDEWTADRLFRYDIEFIDGGATDYVHITRRKELFNPPVIDTVVADQVQEDATSTISYNYTADAPQDLSASILEIWTAAAANQANLTPSNIEAAHPDLTLLATQTGDLTWVASAAEIGLHVMFRVRAYMTAAGVPGSQPAYSPNYGPIASAAGYDPIAVLGAKLPIYFDLSDTDGGTVGSYAGQWEIAKNLADLSGDTDYNTAVQANQLTISNIATTNAAETLANGRLDVSSWAVVGDVVAAATEKRIFLVAKMPTGIAVADSFFVYGGGAITVETDSLNKITIPNLTTPNNWIDPGSFFVLEIGFRTGPVCYAKLHHGSGAGYAGEVVNASTIPFGLTGINNTNNYFDVDGIDGSLWRVVAVSTNSLTVQEETDFINHLIAIANLSFV